MSHRSIFEYFTSQITVNTNQLLILVEYLIRHRDLFLDQSRTQTLFKTRPLVTSPLSRVFTRAVDVSDEDCFSLVYVPTGTKSVPEVLTTRFLTMDISQMGMVSNAIAAAVKPIPELHEKIILNITQMIRSSGGFSDISGFQNTVVRDLLSRSYAKSLRTTWLTPNLSQFVSKVYSMSLGSAVAQRYNLDFHTQSMLGSLFAYFFLSQMTDAATAEQILKSKSKYFHLPDADSLDQIFGLIEDTLQTRELNSLDDVLAVIAKLGVERVKINRSILMSQLKQLGPDTYTSSLALEYPPYFIYLMLLALSGSKIGLSFRMKQMNLLKEASSFTDDLLFAPDLFEALTMKV
jgi:hypothetical protein